MADQKKNFSNVVTNRTTEFSASAPATFTAGRTATIEVDTGVEWIDMDTAVLLADLTLNQAASATAIGAVRYTSSAYIGTLAIKTASNQPLGDPMTGYNFIARQEQEFTENTDYAASYGDATERTAGLTAANPIVGGPIKLCHKPRTHLFNKGYYPAHYHGGFKILITMAPNDEVILAGHATHSYTISNLRLSANLVTFTGETETAQRAQVAAGYHINYKTKHLVQTTLDVTVSTGRHQAHLGSVPSPLDTIQTYQILDTPVIAADKFAAVVPYTLDRYQYTLAGKPLTDHVIDCKIGANTVSSSAQRVHELLKSRGMLDGHFKNLFGSTTLTSALQNTTKFAIGQKVSKGDDESEISSRRTNSTNALKLFYSRTAPAGAGAKSWMTVLTLDKNLVILPGSQVRNQDFLDYINP